MCKLKCADLLAISMHSIFKISLISAVEVYQGDMYLSHTTVAHYHIHGRIASYD